MCHCCVFCEPWIAHRVLCIRNARRQGVGLPSPTPTGLPSARPAFHEIPPERHSSRPCDATRLLVALDWARGRRECARLDRALPGCAWCAPEPTANCMMISWSNEMSWPKFGPKRWKLMGAEAVALPESETAAAFLAAAARNNGRRPRSITQQSKSFGQEQKKVAARPHLTQAPAPARGRRCCHPGCPGAWAW